MTNFIAVVHIILAIALIILVLVQDSKGDGALGIGGTGSNSLLGATGATTLAAKMTRIVAGLLAVTCLYLTFQAGQGQKSVLDSTPAQAQQPSALPTNAGPATPPNNNNPGGTPVNTTTAAPPAAAAPATTGTTATTVK